MSKLMDITEHIENRAPPDDRKELTAYMHELAGEFNCDISIVRQAVRQFKNEAKELNMPLNEYVRFEYYDASAIEQIQKSLYAQILAEQLEPPILPDDAFKNKVIPELAKAYAKDYYVDLADSTAALERIVSEANKSNMTIQEYWNTKNDEIQKELDHIKKRTDKEGDFDITPTEYPLLYDISLLLNVKEGHEKIKNGLHSYASPYPMMERLIRRSKGGGGTHH